MLTARVLNRHAVDSKHTILTATDWGCSQPLVCGLWCVATKGVLCCEDTSPVTLQIYLHKLCCTWQHCLLHQHNSWLFGVCCCSFERMLLWLIHWAPVKKAGLFCLRKEKKRKEKTTPFGVNLMRSQVVYRAAQVSCLTVLSF